MADADLDRANTARIRQLDTLDRLAQRFGQSLTAALARSAGTGRQLDSVLASVGTRLAGAAARAVAAPVRAGVTGLVNALIAGDSAAETPLARGGVLRGGRVTPFAAGGVVAAPTYFPLRSAGGGAGTGLMGEAGPEAVMPLARGPDGRLGVAAGGAARPVTVSVQITTPDPEAFRRSQAQVAAQLARAVARGQRAL